MHARKRTSTSALTQYLIEVLGVGEHEIKLLPRGVIVRRSDDELFDLFELMNAENAASVATVRADLLAETS